MLFNLIISEKQTIETFLHLKKQKFFTYFDRKVRHCRYRQTIVIWKTMSDTL